ncbi:MAG TPA: hypothetical protein VJK54_09250, partial [Chthoniobacterales bacterium]|nr:hypothetical protein [Chthoniobacterales bacterium]
NKEEITRFNKADWSIRFSAEQLEAAVACTEEAIQAERSRNKDISDLWIKTAEQYQVAAEYERKNAETRMLDNEQEKKRWQEVSAFARYSADRLKTAVEALEASFIETYQGDEAIANLWEKIVVENQMTAEYWKKAEEAQVAGNEGNINRFKYAADSARYGADQLSEAVEPLQNAIKAAKQGNQPLSEIWHKSAEQHEISAMHYLKAAASEALGTYIPSNQYSRLDKAAYDASCSAKQFQTVAEGYPSKNEQEYIQAKEAAKIYASGDKEKCERLEKTAGITYFLSEESRCLAEIAESKESGNTEKISLLHKSAQYNKVAADSMKSSLDRLEKASEASRIDNHSLSTLWGKTAEQYQQAAEYYHKSAEGYETDCKEDSRRVGKKEGWKEGQRFGGDWKGLDSGFEFNSGCGRRSLQGAFQLEKSIECTEKAISAEEKENQSLSDLWHKAAEQYQIAADYSSKHAQARASSWHFTGDEKANQLMCQADAAWKIAQQLEYAAIALEKAIKADNHNQPLADLWRKTAEQHQVAVEYGYKHAENLVFKFANPHASKKENPRFYETRDAAISSAERFKEAAIAFKNTEVESEREMASKIAHLSSEEKEHLMKAKNAFSMIKYASDNFFSNHARAKEASEVFHEAAYRAVIVTRVLAGRNYRDLLDYRPTGIDDNIDKSYLNSNDDFIRAASHAAKLASNIYYIFSSYASSHNRIAILQIDAATSFAVDACSAGVGTDYEKEINEMADIIRRLKVYVYTEGEKNNEEQLKRVDKETQEESAIATKKEDSIAEKAEEGAVATITDTPSPKIKKRQFKIQPFHQTVEQIIQLETKRIALKERAALLLSETTEAHSRGELFLTKGQQALTVQLNQALEEVEKALHEGTVATFQACMSRLQQFEEKDHYFQQIALQLQQLDQSKIALVKQGINLKNSIKILQDQNETFLVQDQERLLMEAGKLYLKIHQIEGQLVTKAEKASEQAEELLLQCAEFQQQVEALQDKVKIIATEKALNEKQEIERKAKAEDVRVAEEKVLEQERVTKEESNPSEPEALRLQVEKKE